MIILYILMGFLGGWGMMHGLIVPAGKYHSSGSVWGCKFKGKGNTLYWLLALAGFLLTTLCIVLTVVTDEGSDYLFGAMIALLAGIGFSFATWIMVRNKCYASNHISSAIANVAFMPALDYYSAQCHHFELGVNGIVFYDETNYRFAQIIFADYRVGDLEGSEITFACYGLAQRFHGVFKCTIEDRTVGRDVKNDIIYTQRHYIYRRK